MVTPLPPPGPIAVLGWILALCALAATALAHARARRIGPVWILAALAPALLGQLGTQIALGDRAARASAESVSAASASYAAAVAPEAHGYLAGGLVAVVLAIAGSQAASPAGRGGAVAGGLGVLGATVVALAVGAPSAWLALLGAVALSVAWCAGTRRSTTVVAAGAVAVLLTWLGARHFLLFAQHHAAIGPDLAAAAAVVRARTEALDALMVAGPGMIAAVVAGGLGRLRMPRPSLSASHAALGLVAVGALGFVNTRDLTPLRAAVSGGHLPAAAAFGRLPQVTGATPATGDCVAWWSEEGWQTRSRWSRAPCTDRATIVVGAPAALPVSAVADRTWLTDDATLELLAPVGDPGARGPLGALAWHAVPVRWVHEPLPDAFAMEGRLADQLEDWLDAQLEIERPDAAVPGSVWIVDTPQGDMILMTGGGMTTDDPDHRREILARLLATGDLPRLVLVLGDRWTVRDALDLCAEARHVGPGPVPCVWVSAEP